MSLEPDFSNIRTYAQLLATLHELGERIPAKLPTCIESILDGLQHIEECGVQGWAGCFQAGVMHEKQVASIDELADEVLKGDGGTGESTHRIVTDWLVRQGFVDDVESDSVYSNEGDEGSVDETQHDTNHPAAGLQEHDIEPEKKIWSLIERLEIEVNKLESVNARQEHLKPEMPAPKHENAMKSEETSDNGTVDPEWGSLRSESLSPVVGLDDAPSKASMPGKFLTRIPEETESPPPLDILTTFETQDKNRNLINETARRWLVEEQGRCDSYSQPPSPLIPPARLYSNHGGHYIHYMLHAGFTVPNHNHNPHSYGLTFRNPAHAFHFPTGASRDDLIALLHHRRELKQPGPEFETPKDLSIIRMRTHEMEWDLKNAIAQDMKKKGMDWNGYVSKDWDTEGEGATYVVSASDVYFHGISRVSSEGSDAEDEEDGPRLRGGAGSSEDQETDMSGAESCELSESETALEWGLNNGVQFCPHDVDQLYNTLAEASVPMDAFNWRESAHILQIRLASLDREVERMKVSYDNAHRTIKWQSDQLHTAFKRLADKTDEARDLEDEAAAREEEMSDYNSRVLGALENANKELERCVAMFKDVEKGLGEESSPTSSLRGGCSDCHEHHQQKQEPDVSNRTPIPGPGLEDNAQQVDANAFYFFPSVSTIVLLTEPPSFIQWPRHTTLSQIREFLNHNHEADPSTERVRAIFAAYEHDGTALPDASTGAVFVALPEAANGSSSGCALDRQERENQHARFLNAIRTDHITYDESNASPTSSESTERFPDVADLVNALNGAYDEPTPAPSPRTRRSGAPTPEALHPSRQPAVPHFASWCLRSLPTDEGDELDRSCNFTYEYPPGQRSPAAKATPPSSSSAAAAALPATESAFPPPPGVDDDDEWYHARGQGCESWLSALLDPRRTCCTFCYVPFKNDDGGNGVQDLTDLGSSSTLASLGEYNGDGDTSPSAPPNSPYWDSSPASNRRQPTPRLLSAQLMSFERDPECANQNLDPNSALSTRLHQVADSQRPLDKDMQRLRHPGESKERARQCCEIQTVAGASQSRSGTASKRRRAVDEYDGMIWGGYI
ncbi:hypothetical protein BDV95DRAFT_593157 [Massariosphaeria phaeospora]|uniref:Uncharacterized protein n=1 Tax=Massariosphaeria phaeospora TaxID=100035 RepID=A0A7C8MBS1_9PLEO|nr:hypothetical protein BDV95DRAFT_593157 [Massariosphaeria phaeospora]